MALAAGPMSGLLEFLRSRYVPRNNSSGGGAAVPTDMQPGNNAGGMLPAEVTVADALQRLTVSHSSGAELVLKGRGLRVVPEEVWQVGSQCRCKPPMHLLESVVATVHG
jgi:hypothetical protein